MLRAHIYIRVVNEAGDVLDHRIIENAVRRVVCSPALTSEMMQIKSFRIDTSDFSWLFIIAFTIFYGSSCIIH